MWANIARPFVMLILAFAVLYPARKAVERFLPEGKLKRLLLTRTN